MRASTRKTIAQAEGERAARAGEPRTACPYPQGTAAKPDKYELHFNWQLGYGRGARAMESNWALVATEDDGSQWVELSEADRAVARLRAQLHECEALSMRSREALIELSHYWRDRAEQTEAVLRRALPILEQHEPCGYYCDESVGHVDHPVTHDAYTALTRDMPQGEHHDE